jgi:hypothetical protein
LHWSWEELMSMPTDDRRSFARLLIDQIERENAEIESARNR